MSCAAGEPPLSDGRVEYVDAAGRAREVSFLFRDPVPEPPPRPRWRTGLTVASWAVWEAGAVALLVVTGPVAGDIRAWIAVAMTVVFVVNVAAVARAPDAAPAGPPPRREWRVGPGQWSRSLEEFHGVVIAEGKRSECAVALGTFIAESFVFRDRMDLSFRAFALEEWAKALAAAPVGPVREPVTEATLDEVDIQEM